MFPVQTIVLPSLEFTTPDDMYVRIAPNGGHCELSTGRVVLNAGGCASFDTYFNGVSVEAWKTKAPLDDLTLRLSGRGRFILRFGSHAWGLAHRWLDEREIRLDGTEDLVLPVAAWSSLSGGLLYFSVLALEDGEITGGRFVTDTVPANDVRLGLVITHFNRRQWVLPAIARVRTHLLDDPFYAGRIEMVVVDNSRTIEPEEAAGVTLLPNPNLGGSGGFTRGLMHLEEAGGFTHCLFMDDDASCEIESIRRAHALLSFAKTPKFAVAGALLRDIEPNRLYEKGAIFDGFTKALHGGLDMRSVAALLECERTIEVANYGAWWFFAFALEDVKSYPFPYFVRGDDIAFGLMNRFDIQTMIGISTWGDDFALKASPTTAYLDARHLLLQRLLFFNGGAQKLAKLAYRFFINQVNSYNYASAEAVCLALEHVSRGSPFWRENVDMAEVRAQISALGAEEKMGPIDRSQYGVVYAGSAKRNRRNRLLRKLTFNGQLLPVGMLKQKTMFQPKSFAGDPRVVFKHRRVLYEYEPLKVGYVATHDRARFLRLMVRFAKAAWNFVRNFDVIRQDYVASLPGLTNRAFWEKVYRERS